MSDSRHWVLTAAAALMLASPCTWALRPFDSTDADVARLREVEIELGPLGYLRQDHERFLTAPAVVINYGVATDAELVLQGEVMHALDAAGGEPSTRLVDAGAFVKQVLRSGSLQGGEGPSLATEYGVLLPGIQGDNGVGGSIAGIASQRWPDFSLHLNAMFEATRSHRLGLFAGAIVEGPDRWALRPVVEAFVEREAQAPRTLSGLVGAVWQQREDLRFDLGVRFARQDQQSALELRAGLTWNFSAGER